MNVTEPVAWTVRTTSYLKRSLCKYIGKDGEWHCCVQRSQQQKANVIWVGDKWIPFEDYQARRTYYTRRYYIRIKPTQSNEG